MDYIDYIFKIVVLVVLIYLLYKNKNENFSNISKQDLEGVQNIASMYKNGELKVAKLHVTDNAQFDKNIKANEKITSKHLHINDYASTRRLDIRNDKTGGHPTHFNHAHSGTNHIRGNTHSAVGKLHCDNCVQNRFNIVYKDVTLLCRKMIDIVILLKNDSTLCKIKKFIKGSREMKKYEALSDFGIGRNYSETLIDRVLTYLVKERYIKNTVFRNKCGFYNDRIQLYNKSKELLDKSNDLHIKLPFIDKKNQKEFFIIKPKINKIETRI